MQLYIYLGIFIFTLANTKKIISKTKYRKLLKVHILISIHLRYLYQDKGLWGKGTVEEVLTVFQGNYLQACYQTGSSTPTGKGPTAQKETKQAHQLRNAANSTGNQKTLCDSWIICNKTVTRSSRSSNQPVCQMKQCDTFFTHRDIAIVTRKKGLLTPEDLNIKTNRLKRTLAQ